MLEFNRSNYLFNFQSQFSAPLADWYFVIPHIASFLPALLCAV